jgi:zinc and cadmium transporter
MTPVVWIVVSSLVTSSIALIGGALVLFPEDVQKRLVGPLVAFAAGSLLGGALFHLMPHSVEDLGVPVALGWAAAGFALFALLETAIHHRHHHDHGEDEHPVVWLILLADGLHNFVGGLSVGSAFLVNPTVGIAVWIAEMVHEVPQEIGDYAVLVHGGLSRRRALALNLISGLTFPLGGLVALLVGAQFDPAFLLAFGAGNFFYLAAVDLIPDLLRSPGPKLVRVGALAAGLVTLLVLRGVVPEH